MDLRKVTVNEKDRQIGVLSSNSATHSVLPPRCNTLCWGHQKTLLTPKDKKEMNSFGGYHDPSSALHFLENAVIP